MLYRPNRTHVVAILALLIAFLLPAGVHAQPVPEFNPSALWFNRVTSEHSIELSNVGTGDLVWSIAPTAPWISVSPAAGTNDATLTVQVDRTGLADGSHMGFLECTSNGGDFTIDVLMSVVTVPRLNVSQVSIEFDSRLGSRGVTVSNIGAPTLVWSVSADKPWIQFSPAGGTEFGRVDVDVDRFNIPPGPQTGTLTVSSNGGTEDVEIIFTPGLPPNNGTIGVYTDVDGVDCNITDDAPGLLTLYVVQTATAGSFAAEFWAPVPACMTGVTWLADTPQFPVTIGNTQTGFTTGFGSCLPSPILLTAVSLAVSGTSQSCCPYPILGHPAFADGYLHSVNCNQEVLLASPATSMVNGDATCPCMLTVRTEETTWGKLKSLYATDPAKRD